MNKIEVIARRILDWKLNRWDRWYDYDKGVFISVDDFQPEHNLSHAMIIVDRLIEIGFNYQTDGISKVCFNDVCDSGDTLAEAITNAAFTLADNSSIDDAWF